MPATRASQIAKQFPLHERRPPLPSSGTYGAARVASAEPSTLPSELLELLRSARPAWHADAACREHPDVNFFPQRGEDTRAAKSVCDGCLVRVECAAAAVDEKYGIWAGASERERRRLRRQRSLVSAATESPMGDSRAPSPQPRSGPPRRKLSAVSEQIARAHRTALERKQATAS